MENESGYDFEGRRVFLSGPMTGLPDWNRAAFDGAERALREICPGMCAARVFNPASLAPLPGGDAWPHERYMLRTLHELTESSVTAGGVEPAYDALVLLPGWEGSEGARAERAVAEAVGMDVVEWREPKGGS